MDGMLSQDEINALLSGMAADGTMGDSGSNLSDEEMDNLLTDVEKDAIGEVANISMGTSATTLYSLVNRKVNITTPVVTVETWESVVKNYEKPCVFIQIHYKAGLEGTNILVLRETDVKVITDLMMGGDGTNTEGELGELHLSAISEAMNQMMGSAATSLSSMLGKMIDISPPDACLIDMSGLIEIDNIASFLKEHFVKISFRMQIDGLVDSTIIQLYPIDFARSLYAHFITSQGTPEPESKAPEPEITRISEPAPQQMQMSGMNNMGMPMQDMSMSGMNMSGMNMSGSNMGMPMQQMQGMGMGMPMQQMPGMGMGMPMQQMQGMGMPMQQLQNVNIQPAQFQSFSNDINIMQSQENIELIKDVPLEVTVELGRTKKSISEILEFAPGTIVELDKIAGEPIDVLVNGKYVAKGEVVVIEESFGVRITEIVK